MGASKVTSIVLISIILVAVLVSMVNVGMSILMDRPDYNSYCEDRSEVCAVGDEPMEIKNCYPDCDTESYNQAMKDFNQMRFYIFVGLGFILLLLGLLSFHFLY